MLQETYWEAPQTHITEIEVTKKKETTHKGIAETEQGRNRWMWKNTNRSEKKNTYPENNMRKKHHREDPNEGEEEDPYKKTKYSAGRGWWSREKNANIQRQQPQTNGEKKKLQQKMGEKNQSKSR